MIVRKCLKKLPLGSAVQYDSFSRRWYYRLRGNDKSSSGFMINEYKDLTLNTRYHYYQYDEKHAIDYNMKWLNLNIRTMRI